MAIDLAKELYYFNQGNHRQAYLFMGSKRNTWGMGYRFSVWADKAFKVYIQGDFSDWQPLEMERIAGGLWTLQIDQALEGQCYKYLIDHGNGYREAKVDPFALANEQAPKDASIVLDIKYYCWTDQEWMQNRFKKNYEIEPVQIYEVHKSSWKKHLNGENYTFKDLEDHLIPYVKEMGYNYIELMPLMDHPLEASWGYQIIGFYALAAQYGTPQEFKSFVNRAHEAGIGIILDWVPGHYCRNANGLAYFDSSPAYEYQDPNRANNVGWGTLNFDLGKTQVHSFLISNAFYWLNEFHVDGFRVDAVSNMIYRDFDLGPWTPNEFGGNENLQGIDFLQRLNDTIHQNFPGVLMIAEESTSRPGITHPVSQGGLGFDYKWNMGWMNDCLRFFELEASERPSHLRLMTFVLMYQYKEKYILPLSHDEVVHGKGSLLAKMKGSRSDQFANLRLLHGYMMAQPGKKLHFMGNELGQFLEWRFYEELDWEGLQREFNSEYHYYMRYLNQLGLSQPALYKKDHDPSGMEVLDADDLEFGTYAFIRKGDKPHEDIIVLINFSTHYLLNRHYGVPQVGTYQYLIHSQDEMYGGLLKPSQLKPVIAELEPYQGQTARIKVDLPPLSVQYLQLVVE